MRFERQKKIRDNFRHDEEEEEEGNIFRRSIPGVKSAPMLSALRERAKGWRHAEDQLPKYSNVARLKYRRWKLDELLNGEPMWKFVGPAK